MAEVKWRQRQAQATAAQWAAWNGIPKKGEICQEREANAGIIRQKTGDGVTNYNDLPYDFEQAQTGVQSVTGDGVDNTDPENPVISFPNANEVDYGGISVADGLDDLENTKQPINENLTEIAAINFLVGGGEWVYNEAGVLVKKSTADVKKLLNKDIHIVKRDINQGHTGDTNDTLLAFFIEIDPAVVTVTANATICVDIRTSTNASGNAKRLKMWVGPTSGTLVGATQVLEHSNPTIGAFSAPVVRTIELVNSLTSMRFMNLGVGSSNRDDTANQVALATSAAQNWANKIYLMFSIQLANAADSRTLLSVKATISNPDFLL